MAELIGTVRNVIHSPRIRVIIVSVFSAITWFLWAYWANQDTPSQALISGFFQGGVNFITTLFGSSGLEIMFSRLGHSLCGRIFAVAAVSTVSLSFMIGAHIIAGTPNMVLTIFPVYIVIVVFCTCYIIGLSKIQKQYDQEDVVVS